MRDLLVVGGGPAGLAAALFARGAGMEVALIEPRPGPIDKACGEGLMPAAVEALQTLGVALPAGHPFEGIRYVDGAHVAEGRFSGAPGRGVRRIHLHAAMAARAQEVGVEKIAQSARRVEDLGDHVRVEGIEARWLVAADGLSSPIRRQLGLGLPPLRPRRLGLRQHFAVRPWAPMVEVHWSPLAEAYVTPVEPNEVGVAILAFADRLPKGGHAYDQLLAGFPALRQRLGAPTSQVRGAGPFEQRLRRRQVGRILLVGDAAGYLDPLTGEGIRLGLATAEAAIQAISSGHPERYEAAWRAATRRYWWMTDGLLRLSRPPALRRRLVPFLAKAPLLMSWAIEQLGGEAEAKPALHG